MYVCGMLGFFTWSLSLMVIGPIPNSTISELSDSIQDMLAASIFIGSGVCLSGSLIGTRFLRPKADVRLSYKFALWGIPAISGSIGVYVWAIIHDTGSFWLSAYAGSIGLFLCIGVLLNGIDIAFEIARLNDEIEFMKHSGKSIDEIGPSEDDEVCDDE